MKYHDSGIESLIAKLTEARHAYLRANGWTHTSDTPGNFWMWKKENFITTEDFAIEIQIRMKK